MKLFGFYIVICYVTLRQHNVHSRPVIDKGKSLKYPESIVTYLKRYGYLSAKEHYQKVELFEAVTKLKRFMGITSTSMSSKDIETVEKLIMKPRCGELDIHTKPYKLLKKIGSWYTFSYTIKSWSPNISRELQNETIWRSIKKWQEKLPLKATWVDDDSDVEVHFVQEIMNGTAAGLDSTLTKFTHVNNLTYRIYFSENTTTSVAKLLKISTHMFGHVIGLHHHNSHSVMSPNFEVNSFVNNEDLNRARILFGICTKSIDSVFSYMHDGKTYMFKDRKVWRFNDKKYVISGYPKNISDVWNGIPDKFDEFFVWGYNWQTYIFKGTQYYRYDSNANKVSKGYPYPISKGWPGIPDYIDAAFTDLTYKTIFFKGDKIYKFEGAKNKVAIGYPKRITDVYPGLVNNIDTVFRSYADGKIYFFKDLNYWKWNEKYNKADGPYFIHDKWHNLCRT